MLVDELSGNPFNIDFSIFNTNNKNNLFIRLCEFGNLELVKWYYGKFPDLYIYQNNNQAYRKAVRNNNISVVLWLENLDPYFKTIKIRGSYKNISDNFRFENFCIYIDRTQNNGLTFQDFTLMENIPESKVRDYIINNIIQKKDDIITKRNKIRSLLYLFPKYYDLVIQTYISKECGTGNIFGSTIIDKKTVTKEKRKLLDDIVKAYDTKRDKIIKERKDLIIKRKNLMSELMEVSNNKKRKLKIERKDLMQIKRYVLDDLINRKNNSNLIKKLFNITTSYFKTSLTPLNYTILKDYFIDYTVIYEDNFYKYTDIYNVDDIVPNNKNELDNTIYTYDEIYDLALLRENERRYKDIKFDVGGTNMIYKKSKCGYIYNSDIVLWNELAGLEKYNNKILEASRIIDKWAFNMYWKPNGIGCRKILRFIEGEE